MVGATVNLLEDEAMTDVLGVEEVVDSSVKEEATSFLVEVVDCLLDELMEPDAAVDEKADVLDDEAARDEDVAGEEDDEDLTEDDEDLTEDDEDLTEDEVSTEDEGLEDEEGEDVAEEDEEVAIDEDVIEEDAELLEILSPLAKTAKSSCAWSYLP